ncbi:2,4-dihydroxyhept-2-ene-1,7-dioic acid aldolase [Hyphomicrobiales bacterium]|nr:2,4-dihydroxyhept-2-ene-1,7-dioic acid aldolase [Hyphomicrobiales bacterium]CAH1690835.1 2,4-dihydroxyhept-2-ene-1,7-dioic acid aldolase [Hyphomicrobiales bacterium]
MKNALKSKIESGQNCVNGWLSVPSGYSAEVMARSGWDSLTVDLQHGVQDYGSMVQCLQAIAAFPVTPLVRVPTNETGIIGKALDAGAWGIICPMVNSPEEAAALVSACLYPPHGRRSNGPNRATSYADHRPYQAFANDEVMVLPMIETAEAVASLEQILDVPGVGGAYIGPSDLGLAHGLPPIFDREEPEMLAIYDRVVRETARRGQIAGIHTLDAAYAARMFDMGFRFATVASDAALMAKGAQAILKTLEQAHATQAAVRKQVS